MKITIANPLLALDIQIAVSKEETRYYLQGFHVENVEGGGILLVSTDGDRMLVIHDPNGTIDGETAPIKLPAWFIKELKVQMKGKRQGDCSLVIEGDSKANSASLFWVTKQLIRADNVLIDGTFPAWSQVMPVIDHNKPLVKGTFSADHYAAFGSLSEGKQAYLTTYGTDPLAPFLIKVDGRRDAFGLLMPKRTLTNAHYPSWIGADVISRCQILSEAEKAA